MSRSDGDPYRAAAGLASTAAPIEYQSALNDFDARIRSSEAEIDRLKQDVAHYGNRLKVAAESRRCMRPWKSGWGSKLNGHRHRQQGRDPAADSTRARTRSTSRSRISGAQAQRAGYIDKWRDEIVTDLVTANTTTTRCRKT